MYTVEVLYYYIVVLVRVYTGAASTKQDLHAQLVGAQMEMLNPAGAQLDAADDDT